MFSGYANPTVWLIFTAFLFATAVTSTQFGLRVAYLFIRKFGRIALLLPLSVEPFEWLGGVPPSCRAKHIDIRDRQARDVAAILQVAREEVLTQSCDV